MVGAAVTSARKRIDFDISNVAVATTRAWAPMTTVVPLAQNADAPAKSGESGKRIELHVGVLARGRRELQLEPHSRKGSWSNRRVPR